MVRIQIKGGVWKNTEDEILKAAVMKYGKNQWARISSLLVRKSAKQCKSRWYEWLDPSIKKTEWTRAEEEKLLHLAKIMPTQWRTIAPIIGRTAAQCLEHYERLLDAAQEKDGDYDPSEDPRRLRPGEIDPNPESKPARPDPVDMDEDEKEMLSEARARLANTKGKKAKRKAREKQLEEARRLAALQKKRELKAAGINLKRRKRKFTNSIDYNNEIPFQKLAPRGYFDTASERIDSIKKRDDSKQLGKTLRELDGQRRDAEEAREKKKDERRLKMYKKTNLPAAIARTSDANDPEVIKRRGKMSLPSPQMSDHELAELSKAGPGAMVVSGGSAATSTLLGAYGQTPRAARTARTPRTPMGRDTILEETQNLIALTKAQTPLAGDENAELHASDFRGMTPRASGSATPNVNLQRGATPLPSPRRRAMTPSTPSRDALGINQDGAAGAAAGAASGGLSAAQAIMANRSRRAARAQANMLKQKLRESLANLPEAENEYAFAMPSLPKEAEKMDDDDMEEDAEDRAVRLAAEKQALRSAQLARRSTALQRHLPRPHTVNTQMGKDSDSSSNPTAKMIADELVLMLRHDAAKYPHGSKADRKRKRKAPVVEGFSDEQLAAARNMVEAELVGGEEPVTAKRIKNANGEIGKVWTELYSTHAFLPSKKAYGWVNEVSAKDQVAALRQRFKLIKEQLKNDAKEAGKLEKQATLLSGGFAKRARAAHEAITSVHHQRQETEVQLECFKALAAREQQGLPARMAWMKEEVSQAAQKERDLQNKYAALTQEKERLAQLLKA